MSRNILTQCTLKHMHTFFTATALDDIGVPSVLVTPTGPLVLPVTKTELAMFVKEKLPLVGGG